MSKKDSLEEGIKLYRIWAIYGIVGAFYFVFPIFSNDNFVSAQYWGFGILTLISFGLGVYGFWKFYNGVKELNKMTDKNRNSIKFLFMEMEQATWLMLFLLLTTLFWQ